MATSPTPLHLLTFSQFQSSSLEQQKSIFNQFQAVVVKANRCEFCEVKEMPELPVEIREMILNHLDRDGLARCRRLSQYHDGSFRKRLWHKIQLTKRLETISFFECLEGFSGESRARFMECVKELDMQFEDYDPRELELVSELFEMDEWDLFRKLEKLTIERKKQPPRAGGVEEPLHWSAPLGQLSRLKSLVLGNLALHHSQEFRIAPIWPALTSLRLSNVDFDGPSLFDSTTVPNVRDLTIKGCDDLELFLPLAAQIHTLSTSSYELLIRRATGQGQATTYDSILPLFTGLTTLHLLGWDPKVIESISALPNLQHLLLDFNRGCSDEAIGYFTSSREEWIENTSITFSTSDGVTDGHAELERVLESRGVKWAPGGNVQDWLEEFKTKE